MKYGPFLYYKCPNCPQYITSMNVMSESIFNPVYYSDGKLKEGLSLELPGITKCKKCNSIFWLHHLQSHEMDRSIWINTIRKAGSNWADFLSIPEYFRAIDEKKATNHGEFLSLRTAIWHAFNDRIRKGNPIFNDAEEEELWTANCYELIQLLQKEADPDTFMIAEIFRNLGAFSEAIKLLNSIPAKNKYIDQLLIACNEKNRWVIQL